MSSKRIFASSSFLDTQVKKTLMNLVDNVHCDEAPERKLLERSSLHRIWYLFFCEIDYIHQTHIDLHKPILVDLHNMTCLRDALSTQLGSTQPVMQSKRDYDQIVH